MLVSELYVYPIKGCGAVALDAANIDEYGFKGDRRYMVVDDQGVFMSQRKHPEMCRIQTTLSGGFLTVTYNGVLDMVIEPSMETNYIPVQIWDDEVMATDMGEAASLWFSQALGRKARLVTIGSKYNRNVQISDTVYSSKMHFGDACPILVTTTASLEDLNGRLSTPIPMNRFRPNLVIDGAEPYAEDTWKYIRIGDQMLQYGKKCGRCTVTTIDQETGESGLEPLKTLSKYRKDGNKVCFGSYYIPITRSIIKLGDDVVVKS
jgi:uncharacterized protein